MKATYNKSEIFRNAWEDYKGGIASFSVCLKEAWFQAKYKINKVVSATYNNVKDVFESLTSINDYRSGLRNELADEIISKVAKLGYGVAQKIAEQFQFNNKNLSTKQAWCVAFNFMTIK